MVSRSHIASPDKGFDLINPTYEHGLYLDGLHAPSLEPHLGGSPGVLQGAGDGVQGGGRRVIGSSGGGRDGGKAVRSHFRMFGSRQKAEVTPLSQIAGRLDTAAHNGRVTSQNASSLSMAVRGVTPHKGSFT
ncbi:hypothetical protein E2C01_044360 [Portunus trituberculatus]|uniref:Uncharacterized protein n=1 Tax=Portunus trituberculatus TaxID=210409 RepID=A0A5B7FSX5_PORTR|nr:hypothetical protein [Portunus trituberculatus]